MIVKICGLTQTEHALKAAEMGADLIGFVFAPSKRQVTPQKARQIISELSVKVGKVGVFLNEDSKIINEITAYCGLDFVQLHGEETPQQCQMVSRPVIKGFRIRDAASLEQLAPYRNQVEMFLLDTYVAGQPGGTGQKFDWSLTRQAAPLGPILLAGGLDPDNVQTAIAQACPDGVDVSSGVETGGTKDTVKIKKFISQVRGIQDAYIAG